jgi:hypothetical protein
LRIARESKFVDETRSFNDLVIQYPGLKKIYLLVTDPRAKVNNADEETMLKTYCYKYLNLVDSMSIHDAAASKHAKNNDWIDKQIRNETYFGNWCNFYSKQFKKETVGHKIMTDILTSNEITGDYGSQFINMVKYLINKH